MAQFGFDQLQHAMALQAKLVERDCVAAQRAYEAFLQACMADMGGFLQTWRTLMREYVATSEAVWNEEVAAVARNQAAFGALLHDAPVDLKNAWFRTPGWALNSAGTAQPGMDWAAYFGRLVGVHADGEARPMKPVHQTESAHV